MSNKISSNVVSLRTAVESSIGVLPVNAIWRQRDPNTFSDFGSTPSTTMREVLTTDRQLRKGAVTDITANAGFNNDLTQTNLLQYTSAFMCKRPREFPTTDGVFSREDGTHMGVNEITTTTITLDTNLAVSVNDVVVLRGAGVWSNNNIPLLVTSKASNVLTVTAINTGESLTAEAQPPSAASLHVVGKQYAQDLLSLTSNATEVALVRASGSFTGDDLLANQWQVGEWIFVGGDMTVNQFTGVTPFYARIAAIESTRLVFDATDATVPPTVAGTGKKIILWLGTFVSNSPTLDTIEMITFTAERQLGLDDNGAQAEYVHGCVASEFALALEQKALAKADITFMGLTSSERDGTEGLIDGEHIPLPEEVPFNVSTDVRWQRLAIKDKSTMNPDALMAFMTNLNININNNVTIDGAIGVMGGFGATLGDFAVTGSVTAYFVDVAAKKALRCNCTAGVEIILTHSNRGQVWDIPAISLGNGALNIEKGSSITIELDTNAYRSKYGFTASHTNFAYLPDVAMAKPLSDCDCD